MVAELDIIDQEVTKLTDMIDNEIATLVPEWKRGPIIEESSECTSESLCLKCATNGSLFDYVSSNNPTAKNLQFLHCSKNGCAAVHGRFEEITYQVEDSENSATEGAPAASSQSTSIHYTDIWGKLDEPELGPEGLKDIHCNKACDASNLSSMKEDGRTIDLDDQSDRKHSSSPASNCVLSDYENEIRQELRWLKAKYQMQLRDLRDQQLKHGKDGVVRVSVTSHLKLLNNKLLLGSMASEKHFPVDADKCTNVAKQIIQNVDETNSPEQMVTAKDFFKGALLPHLLHRATSLPVDAVDV